MSNVHEKVVLPFKKYIQKQMASYQIGVPLIIATLIALLVGTTVFVQYANSNKTFIESIAPHVATLLETQDRPEIQRFLQAVSAKRGAAIEVISKTDEIIASSFDFGRIGNPFEGNLKELPLLDLKIN